MRRKIITFISLILITSSIILVFIFRGIVRNDAIKKEKDAMISIIEQTYSTLDKNSDLREEAVSLFTDDYLNRAGFASYLIKREEHPFTSEKWNKLIDVLDVEAVYLINNNGIIVESSNGTSLGLDFYEHDELEPFRPIIESKEEGTYFVDFNRYSITTHERKIYLGYSINTSGYSMIELVIRPDILDRYLSFSGFDSVISSIPIRGSRTIFLADMNAEIIASTAKDKTVEMANILETLEKALIEPIEYSINDKPQMLYTMRYKDYYLAITFDLAEIQAQTNNYVIIFTIIISGMSVLLIVLLFILINYYILKDVENLKAGVNDFIQHGKSVSFSKARTHEINELSNEISDVIDAVLVKKDRLSYMTRFIGDDFEAYEYYPQLNQFYFSDNLVKMMELEESEVKRMIVNLYKENIENLKNRDYENESVYVTKSGRFLRGKRTFTRNALFTIIQDITEIRKQQELLENELIKEKENSNLDPLTKIYNRQKIKMEIEKYITTGLTGGVVLLMDLDNFKRVNDTAGHFIGDEVLIKFASIINYHFYQDIKSRLGGDEFMIFMPNSISINSLTDKLNNFIEDCHRQLREYYVKYRLSVSIGAMIISSKNKTFDNIYEVVDAAMYIAKRQGKDRFYINEECNTCMKEVCTNCKKNCAKRDLLFKDKKNKK